MKTLKKIWTWKFFSFLLVSILPTSVFVLLVLDLILVTSKLEIPRGWDILKLLCISTVAIIIDCFIYHSKMKFFSKIKEFFLDSRWVIVSLFLYDAVSFHILRLLDSLYENSSNTILKILIFIFSFFIIPLIRTFISSWPFRKIKLKEKGKFYFIVSIQLYILSFSTIMFLFSASEIKKLGLSVIIILFLFSSFLTVILSYLLFKTSKPESKKELLFFVIITIISSIISALIYYSKNDALEILIWFLPLFLSEIIGRVGDNNHSLIATPKFRKHRYNIHLWLITSLLFLNLAIAILNIFSKQFIVNVFSTNVAHYGEIIEINPLLNSLAAYISNNSLLGQLSLYFCISLFSFTIGGLISHFVIKPLLTAYFFKPERGYFISTPKRFRQSYRKKKR